MAGDGEAVIGKLLEVTKDDMAVVQTDGYMELPGGDGASLTRGKKIVGDLDSGANKGFIREVNTAQAAELGVARGFIQDASTASATLVKL